MITINMKSAGFAALMGLAAVSPAAVASEDTVPLPPSGSTLRWTPDQQIVGFRQIEKINPVRMVGRGTHVHSLPIAIHQISPHWTWKDQAMDVDSHMAAARVSGVIVLKDGKVLLERYGLGRTAKDRWLAQSVTKSVTAILVGAAIKDGYIKGLDAPVIDYIPELKDSAYEGVTVRQLITMTSGVKWDENYTPSTGSAPRAVPLAAGMDPVVALMRTLPRENQPGTKFNYNTNETNLAGILVSNAAGKTLSEYLSDKLWRPYGMEEDAFWWVDSAGREYAGSSLSMTLRDYARIGQFVLEGGKAGGVDVLPPGWVEDMTGIRATFPPGYGSGQTGYGYFWWIYPDGYAASGIFGQKIFVYPKDKVVIAVNSAWPMPTDPEASRSQLAFIEALHTAAMAHTE